MFPDKYRNFMSENMKIDVDSIELKIDEIFTAKHKNIVINTICRGVDEIESVSINENSVLHRKNKAQESIDKHYLEIIKDIDNSNAKEVLDTLRHAFFCYAGGGLRALYENQENESWYPKIILTEVLSPNDIDLLDEEIIIYRGCNIEEFEGKKFKQAWTTSREVAENFAYSHYCDREWFAKDKRVVLAAKYLKKDVLYSNQSKEYEIVVDVEKLRNVHKI